MKIRVFGEIGIVVELEGQRYELIRFGPHITKAGRETMLAVWQTACAECGAEFGARQPAGSVEFSRRCTQHRQPGKRVRVSLDLSRQSSGGRIANAAHG
jgi:hypothetical protein